MEIDRGINERVAGAAILGLDVIGDFAYFHVGIVTKKHRVLHLFPHIGSQPPRGTFSTRFDRPAGESVL